MTAPRATPSRERAEAQGQRDAQQDNHSKELSDAIASALAEKDQIAKPLAAQAADSVVGYLQGRISQMLNPALWDEVKGNAELQALNSIDWSAVRNSVTEIIAGCRYTEARPAFPVTPELRELRFALAEKDAEIADLRRVFAELPVRMDGDRCSRADKADAALTGSELDIFRAVTGDGPVSDRMMPVVRLRQHAKTVDAALAASKAREEELRKALTPSAETKSDYIGKFEFPVRDGYDDFDNEIWRDVAVPWITIKEIMAAILARATLT